MPAIFRRTSVGLFTKTVQLACTSGGLLMSSLLRFCLTFCVLAPALGQAAVLENPSGGNFYSGVGVVSGWKCDAEGALTVRFYDAAMTPVWDPIPFDALRRVRKELPPPARLQEDEKKYRRPAFPRKNRSPPNCPTTPALCVFNFPLPVTFNLLSLSHRSH